MHKIAKIISFMLIFVLIIPSLSFAASDDITLYIDGNKVSCDVPPVISNGRTLVPARVIFEHFDAKVYWNDTVKQATIATKDKTIILTINSNTAVVNSQRKKLDAAPIIKEGRTLIPVRFISETLGYDVSWDNKTRSVKITSKGSTQSTPNVNDTPNTPSEEPKIEYDFTISKVSVKNNSTNAVITITSDCTSKPKMMTLSSPYRLVFDFDNTLISGGDAKISVDTGYIKEVRYAQHESSARVVIECNGTQPYDATFKKGISTIEVGNEDSYIEESNKVLDDNVDDPDYKPDNDTTDDKQPDDSEKPDIDKEDTLQMTDLEFLASRNPDNLLVVIDAGHGGSDPGAIGYDSDGKIVVKEKDANLKIANKVAAILKKRGINVKQTRSTDVYLPLAQISNYANSVDADIFVSIHNNAVADTSVSGMMVLYNGNGWDGYGIDGKTIATFIKNEIAENVDIENRGIVSRPGLWVLRKTDMPAVLVECAFVTNEGDRKLLLDDSVLDMFAVSIANGTEQSLNLMRENILAARETVKNLKK